MKNKLFFTYILVIALVQAALSCSNDTENGGNKKDETKTDSFWPSTEEMMSEEYFPVGTQWDELFVLMKETDSATFAETGKTYLPYEYYLNHNIVDYDIEFNGKRIHHVANTCDFVPPEDKDLERELFGYVTTDGDGFYIEEDSGRVYNVYYNPSEFYKPELEYDFVWTEGKELYRVTDCWHQEYRVQETEQEDGTQYLGTVSTDSIEYRTLLDGKDYMYIPYSKTYRGIGSTEGVLFSNPPELVPTCMFPMYIEAVGLARFSRCGTVIYEDQELLYKVSDKYKE